MRQAAIIWCVALSSVAGWSGSALAQSETAFVAAFSGTWQTLDPAFSGDGACRIVLSGTRDNDQYALESSNCAGPMASLQGWAIVDNQLGLLGPDRAVIARLGGNQNRMSGQTASGSTVVFERITEEAAAAPAVVSASQTTGCVFYGYTATCATPDDLARPTAASEDVKPMAEVLVRLNARSEARPDASVVATIPPNTCVVIDECTTASDGNWCKARISDVSGWIRQQTVRQNRWPIVTYTGKCG